MSYTCSCLELPPRGWFQVVYPLGLWSRFSGDVKVLFRLKKKPDRTLIFIAPDPGGHWPQRPYSQGWHVQNRIRCRPVRGCRYRTGPKAEQPRVDGGPSGKVKAKGGQLTIWLVT